MSREENSAKILKLCAKDFKTPAEIADALGLSQNSVRAHYLYPMTQDGLLKRLHAQNHRRQAYKKA